MLTKGAVERALTGAAVGDLAAWNFREQRQWHDFRRQIRCDQFRF
jgi:hypothetical protein